jgi:hypothetical protein
MAKKKPHLQSEKLPHETPSWNLCPIDRDPTDDEMREVRERYTENFKRFVTERRDSYTAAEAAELLAIEPSELLRTVSSTTASGAEHRASRTLRQSGTIGRRELLAISIARGTWRIEQLVDLAEEGLSAGDPEQPEMPFKHVDEVTTAHGMNFATDLFRRWGDSGDVAEAVTATGIMYFPGGDCDCEKLGCVHHEAFNATQDAIIQQFERIARDSIAVAFRLAANDVLSGRSPKEEARRGRR